MAIDLGPIGSVLAYDRRGRIVSTTDWLVRHDALGRACLVDFYAMEREGRIMAVVRDPEAIGAGTWPQWLSEHWEWRVEVGQDGMIAAIVHRQSNARVDRAALLAEVERRVEAARGVPINASDLLGSPLRPLVYRNGALRPVETEVEVPL